MGVNQRLPILDTDQLKELDKLMVADYHISTLQLMECAGVVTAQCARYLLEQNVVGKKIVICAGKGNNGGDGLVSARHLSNWGADVSIVLSNQIEAFKSEPQQHLKTIQAMSIACTESPNHWGEVIQKADLVIDAVLGFGIKGEPRGNAAQCIDLINQHAQRILALDCPSGLDSQQGIMSKKSVKAQVTLSLGCLKKGMDQPSIAKECGDLYCGDIGIPAEVYQTWGFDMPNGWANSGFVQVKNGCQVIDNKQI